jgi:predicted membrane channel-forming protein YqfA (hemolysin III family)
MSRIVRFARAISERPTEAIEGIIAFAVTMVGLWFVSPFYHPSDSVSAQAWSSGSIPQYIGAFQAVVGAFLLFALMRKEWKRRQMIRRTATFAIFILYLFYGLTATIILGMGRVSWIATFALALISGVVHLRLKWEEGNHARD